MQIDVTAEHWSDLVDGQNVTADTLQNRDDDVLAVLQGGIDTNNISTGGLLPADMDGVAATLDDDSIAPGTQTWGRDNQFNGDTGIGGTLTRTQAEVSIVATGTIDVAGINTLVVKNATASNYNITGFTGGVEGQCLTVMLVGSSTGNTVLENAATAAADPPAGELILQGTTTTDYTHAGSATRQTGRVSIFEFVCSNAFDYYTNLVWFEKSRRTA